MTREPGDTAKRRHPRNPWIGLLFAAMFLFAAGFGAIVLIDQFSRVIGGELYGQRSEGFLLFGPVIFAALGILTLVRAITALRPWGEYRGRVELTQRRADKALDLDGQVRWPLAIIAVLSLAGLIALFLPTPNNTAGWLLLFEFQILAALIFTATAGMLAQSLYYARFLPARRGSL